MQVIHLLEPDVILFHQTIRFLDADDSPGPPINIQQFENDSRYPETELAGLEPELGAHRIHDTQGGWRKYLPFHLLSVGEARSKVGCFVKPGSC